MASFAQLNAQAAALDEGKYAVMGQDDEPRFLEAQGHETKISFAENQIILVTSALPRTLRKARQAKPIAQDPMNVLQNIFDSVGKYTQTPPCEVAK